MVVLVTGALADGISFKTRAVLRERLGWALGR
jgi:hypothetical protein